MEICQFGRRSALVIEDYHFTFITIKSAFRKWQIWLNNFINTPLFIYKCVIHRTMRNMYTKIKKSKLVLFLNRIWGRSIFFNNTMISMIAILSSRQSIIANIWINSFESTNWIQQQNQKHHQNEPLSSWDWLAEDTTWFKTSNLS